MAAATGNGGEWSSGHASPALPSGQYTAVATQKSLLGNPAGTSKPQTFEVDTASPTVTLNEVTSPSNDTTPSFTGTASDTTPVVVHIYNAANSEVSNVTASPAGGNWTSAKISPALSSGTLHARSRARRVRSGTRSGASAPVAFTVDTEPPTVTLSSPALRSNNTTPSFSGTASDTTTVTIEIYAGAKAKGTAVSSAMATPVGGDWSSSSASPSLKNGQYTAVASQESSLGNPAGTSESRTFEVDTASPTVTLNAAEVAVKRHDADLHRHSERIRAGHDRDLRWSHGERLADIERHGHGDGRRLDLCQREPRLAETVNTRRSPRRKACSRTLPARANRRRSLWTPNRRR